MECSAPLSSLGVTGVVLGGVTVQYTPPRPLQAYAGPVAALTPSDLKGTSGILMLLPWQHDNEVRTV